ncbi:AAA family ATPase [Streptomyces nigrescens]
MGFRVGHVVGRGAEMTELARWAASAAAGEGRAAFVVGEAGLGKTALLELAAAHARVGGDAHPARGGAGAGAAASLRADRVLSAGGRGLRRSAPGPGGRDPAGRCPVRRAGCGGRVG